MRVWIRNEVIEMRMKGINPRKKGSTTETMLQLSNRCSETSSTGKEEIVASIHPFNFEAYKSSKQRMLEIDTQKAIIISLSRHEKWKAGGPL